MGQERTEVMTPPPTAVVSAGSDEGGMAKMEWIAAVVLLGWCVGWSVVLMGHVVMGW